MPHKPILILGTHLLAHEMLDLIEQIPGREVVGFVENLDQGRCEGDMHGRPIYWIDDVSRFAGTHHAVCSISTTHRVGFIQQASDLGLEFPCLIHPSAQVSPRSTIGVGSFISPGCIVASHSTIGRYAFLNRGVMIGHHTTLGDYVTVQPGANVAGACVIEERAYIGISCVVIDRIQVGAKAVVGAGAVVVKNVPEGAQVVGVPARVVKEGLDGK